MNKKTIDQVELQGKRVFIRVDFNVPLTPEGTVREDTRIRRALPTIQKAIEKGGRVVLASHLGRPKGQRVPEMSLKPAAERLSELLGQPVGLAPDCIGDDVAALADALKPGEVLLLENVRYHAGETTNDPEFAKALAMLADIHVNDAFGTAHRAHASNVGVSELVKPSVAGLLMANEIEYFNRAMAQPERPVAAILGGSKVSGKINVIDALLDRVDKVLIGGGMAFTFFKALGYDVGNSLVEAEMTDVAQKAMDKAKQRGVELILPVDAIAAQAIEEGAETQVVSVKSVPEGWMGLDIGPDSVKLFQDALADVKTVVWNGPMGVFEKPDFATGTVELAKYIGASSALSVIGGGDTDAAVKQAGVADQVSYISTGGGAFLELLEGKTLPGIAALDDA
ncbi:MAG: phosphoglycerate kinase [Magnetococcales bacterium]|nr:phosphoglycerate kinase [Magnetococcales bacterium]